MYTHFVEKNLMTLEFLIDRMSHVPARLFNLPMGELKVGGVADIAVCDLEKE